MPELPEVEVTRLGLMPRLVGQPPTGVVARRATLRYPIPDQLDRLLRNKPLLDIRRRGKYLLFVFDHGHLLVHLGMSGSLRVVGRNESPAKHDHLDIVFTNQVLRLRDPRRFGAVLWVTGNPCDHPLLQHLGMEPLERGFTPRNLEQALASHRIGIKPAIMDSRIVVGIGNIYASESLHLAGIDPRRPANLVSVQELEKLVPAIKKILRAAIRAGGSSLRDYVSCEGGLGDFQTRHMVYALQDTPCATCGNPIKMLRQAGRTTYYCPHCQR